MTQHISAKEYLASGSEHDLQVQIITYLRRQWFKVPTFVFSIPNAGKRSPSVARRMKREGLLAGVFDIGVMMDDAKMGWLEVKVSGRKLTPQQEEFRDVCRALKHPHAVVRSLDDAIAALKKWGVI